MSRVINFDSPGKLRSQLMRTSAEILHRLGTKTEIDQETRDMAAFLFYCLREIDNGIEESVVAWEKRDYWVKVEQFRLRWLWVKDASRKLEDSLRTDSWDQLPLIMIALFPYFEGIKVVKYTRSPDLWQGAFARLTGEMKKGEKVT